MALAGLIAGGGYFWYLESGGSSTFASASTEDLPKSDLAEMTFPKPESLGHADGTRMCEAAGAAMKRRGYVTTQAGREGTLVRCRWNTSGLSLLKKGDNALFVELTLRAYDDEGAAVERVESSLGQAAEAMESKRGRGEKARLEGLRIGDEGYVFNYADEDLGYTDAVARSGAHLMTLSVWGHVQGATTMGGPLAESVTRGELADIVKSINGQGGAGPSRISRPGLRKNPVLTGLPTPTPPTKPFAGQVPPESSLPQICGPFSGAKRLPGIATNEGNTDRSGANSTWYCHYRSAESGKLEVTVTVKEHKGENGTVDDGSFGRELKSILDRTAPGKKGILKAEKQSPLYELPVGDGGYAYYYVGGFGQLQAGYTIGASTYVLITIEGWHGQVEPLPESTMLGYLATMLKGSTG